MHHATRTPHLTPTAPSLAAIAAAIDRIPAPSTLDLVLHTLHNLDEGVLGGGYGHLPPYTSLGAHSPLLDSACALDWTSLAQLRAELCDILGLDLPPSLFDQHPTPAKIAASIDRHLQHLRMHGSPPATQPAAGSPEPPPAAAPASAAAATPAAGVAPPRVLVVLLPGVDGSMFHFRALTSWLSTSLQDLTLLKLQVPTGETSGLASWMADSAAAVLRARTAGCRLVLMGYSLGGALVPLLLESLPSGVTFDGAVLLDPTSLTELEAFCTTPELLSPTRVIATSVMDSVPQQLDEPRLKAALIAAFPSFAARFDAAERIPQLLSTFGPPLSHEPSRALASLPALLLLHSEHNDEFVDAVHVRRDWLNAYPHLTALVIPGCDHLTIPYTSEAAEIIVGFIGIPYTTEAAEIIMGFGGGGGGASPASIANVAALTAVSPEAMANGRAKFNDVCYTDTARRGVSLTKPEHPAAPSSAFLCPLSHPLSLFHPPGMRDHAQHAGQLHIALAGEPSLAGRLHH